MVRIGLRGHRQVDYLDATTLLFVPVVYTYFDGMGAWLKHRFISREREREIQAEQPGAEHRASSS